MSGTAIHYMAMAANSASSRTDCPHYLARGQIEEYQKHITEITLELPNDRTLFWCGGNEQWRRSCSPCIMYNFLTQQKASSKA
jgi:hypothetical protein